MKRDIVALGGEWDIFKKIRHRVCRKKVVLEYEEQGIGIRIKLDKWLKFCYGILQAG